MGCCRLVCGWVGGVAVAALAMGLAGGARAQRRVQTGSGVAAALAQETAPVPESAAIGATREKMTAVRDQFVAQLKADGFSCPIAPPKVLVEDVPSLGQYDNETNTLRTADFSLLNPQERDFMRHLAGPDASEAEMRVVFEKAAHQWIFVHELGHWWQACRGVTSANTPPWQVESGANRISLAYWRAKDPSVTELMIRLFHQVLGTMPPPLPAGESVEAYFNKNYERLGPSPVYPWFQSKMNSILWDEKPEPSLKRVLTETTK